MCSDLILLHMNPMYLNHLQRDGNNILIIGLLQVKIVFNCSTFDPPLLCISKVSIVSHLKSICDQAIEITLYYYVLCVLFYAIIHYVAVTLIQYNY